MSGSLRLKKLNKSAIPTELTQFVVQTPKASWDDFKNNSQNDYKKVKKLIFTDQGERCAYCEKALKKKTADKKRIEYYHSKSDKSNPNMNWALEWSNIIGVCLGGSDKETAHLLPENLSCDAHKAHLEEKKKLHIPCDGYVLNPLDIIANPTLFDFDKSQGKLKANSTACALCNPDNNQYVTVEKLVEKTIEIFNLNCERLVEQRLLVFHQYEHFIKSAKKVNNTQIHSQLAKRWFNHKWPSFFTTRRIMLGSHSEKYLNSIQYEG